MTSWAEVQIPVPWGFIAAKTWGDEMEKPILCIHGGLDNGASFDYLIPLLPKKYYYVCIDLPGHGQSSHFGPGIPYRMTDYISVIKRIVDHFQWTKLYLIGHHSGSLLGFFFASCFTTIVEKLIVLDPVIGEYKIRLSQVLLQISQELLAIDNKAVLYDYKDLIQKVRSWRHLHLSSKAEEVITKRNVERVGNKFKLTLDPRVNFVFYPPYELQHLQLLLKPLKCQLLIVMSKGVLGNGSFPVRFFINMFRENCCHFEYHLVACKNDVHINKPELILTYIQKFLDYPKSSL